MKPGRPDAEIIITPNGRRIVQRPGPIRIGVAIPLDPPAPRDPEDAPAPKLEP